MSNLSNRVCFSRGEISFLISCAMVGDLPALFFFSLYLAAVLRYPAFLPLGRTLQRWVVPRSPGVATARLCRSGSCPCRLLAGLMAGPDAAAATQLVELIVLA